MRKRAGFPTRSLRPASAAKPDSTASCDGGTTADGAEASSATRARPRRPGSCFTALAARTCGSVMTGGSAIVRAGRGVAAGVKREHVVVERMSGSLALLLSALSCSALRLMQPTPESSPLFSSPLLPSLFSSSRLLSSPLVSFLLLSSPFFSSPLLSSLLPSSCVVSSSVVSSSNSRFLSSPLLSTPRLPRACARARPRLNNLPPTVPPCRSAPTAKRELDFAQTQLPLLLRGGEFLKCESII